MEVNNQEKEKKHDKLSLLAKAKLNSVEALISNGLIDLNITHDEMVSINNVQKEYVNMKEEIKKI